MIGTLAQEDSAERPKMSSTGKEVFELRQHITRVDWRVDDALPDRDDRFLTSGDETSFVVYR